jgi:hypothetical protein
MDDPTTQIPSIGISLQVPLANARQMVLQSFVERECQLPVLNALLDKLRLAADRQNAIAQREQAEKMLQEQEKQARDHMMRMAQAEANAERLWTNGGRKGEMRLSAKEEEEKRKAYQNAQILKDNMERIKADIRRFDQIIGA